MARDLYKDINWTATEIETLKGICNSSSTASEKLRLINSEIFAPHNIELHYYGKRIQTTLTKPIQYETTRLSNIKYENNQLIIVNSVVITEIKDITTGQFLTASGCELSFIKLNDANMNNVGLGLIMGSHPRSSCFISTTKVQNFLELHSIFPIKNTIKYSICNQHTNIACVSLCRFLKQRQLSAIHFSRILYPFAHRFDQRLRLKYACHTSQTGNMHYQVVCRGHVILEIGILTVFICTAPDFFLTLVHR